MYFAGALEPPTRQNLRWNVYGQAGSQTHMDEVSCLTNMQIDEYRIHMYTHTHTYIYIYLSMYSIYMYMHTSEQHMVKTPSFTLSQSISAWSNSMLGPIPGQGWLWCDGYNDGYNLQVGFYNPYNYGDIYIHKNKGNWTHIHIKPSGMPRMFWQILYLKETPKKITMKLPLQHSDHPLVAAAQVEIFGHQRGLSYR